MTTGREYEYEPVKSEKRDEKEATAIKIEIEQSRGELRNHDRTLVYRSDFTKPIGWDEKQSGNVKRFRLDGYYHIAIYEQSYYAWFNPPIIMDDFRARAEVELNIQSGKTTSCGLVFCVKKRPTISACMCFRCLLMECIACIVKQRKTRGA